MYSTSDRRESSKQFFFFFFFLRCCVHYPIDNSVMRIMIYDLCNWQLPISGKKSGGMDLEKGREEGLVLLDLDSD